MFKFIKAKGPHQTAERQKLQKELYSYRRVSTFYFIYYFKQLILKVNFNVQFENWFLLR